MKRQVQRRIEEDCTQRRSVANNLHKRQLSKEQQYQTQKLTGATVSPIGSQIKYSGGNGGYQSLVVQRSKYKQEDVVLLDGGTKVKVVEVKKDAGTNEEETVYVVESNSGDVLEVRGDEIKSEEEVNRLTWNKLMTEDEVVDNLILFSQKMNSNIRDKKNPPPYGLTKTSREYREHLKDTVHLTMMSESEYEETSDIEEDDKKTDPIEHAMEIASRQYFTDANHRMTMALIYTALQKREEILGLQPLDLYYELYQDRGEDNLEDHSGPKTRIENLLFDNDRKSGKDEIREVEQSLANLTGEEISEKFKQEKEKKRTEQESELTKKMEEIMKTNGWKKAVLYDETFVEAWEGIGTEEAKEELYYDDLKNLLERCECEELDDGFDKHMVVHTKTEEEVDIALALKNDFDLELRIDF